jgi:hypothetical protein
LTTAGAFHLGVAYLPEELVEITAHYSNEELVEGVKE